MLIYVFPPHYQLVYINFDISSFSLISYMAKQWVLACKRVLFTILFVSSLHARSQLEERRNKNAEREK